MVEVVEVMNVMGNDGSGEEILQIVKIEAL